MPRHVLVPVDESTQGYAGLEYSLVSFPNASVTALSVVDPTHDNIVTVGETESPIEQARSRAERVLERATELADEHGREIRTVVRTGATHKEILSVATDGTTDDDGDGIDHIVLGSHGTSPVSHPFLGRVSEAVVRRSPVSTTVVPEPRSAIRERTLPGSVLVPIDGSEQADAALRYALDTFPDGDHTVLHVITLPIDEPRAAVEGTYLEEIVAESEHRAETILDSARGIATEYTASVETATEYGKPAAEIVSYAEECDQIVLGRHGRSLRKRLVTGSVAKRVADRTPTTVTLIHGSP